MSFFSDVERDLVVAARTPLADGVVALDLVSHNGRDLPVWTPGSHVDVLLAPGVERQYSLCGDLHDRSRWRIAVLREDAGRGGSVRLHDEVVEGQRLRVRGPRNHFAFEVTPGTRYRFLAGGIGITALRAMVATAEAAGADWTLEYAGRSRATMAFVAELTAAHPGRVTVHAADEGARLDVRALLAQPRSDTAVYVCGPTRLIDAVEETLADWPPAALHAERFEAREFGEPVWPDPFEVELALSGTTVVVEPGQSVLDAVAAEGVVVLSSCRVGTCGTCETPVLEGAVEHRDSVLTPAEQAEDVVMMVCVSRAAGPRLVLDL
ncbi:oxidoreductase [Modestobacter muralis]|uniref:Oxidoreductase n=1 Tax=Modestobacter muralis TaxID=1608614 RepID=A0A6P0EQY9_9ACTN|nr:oxidoreductase [Modestobacter muralis]NEN49980.1 oxidoreductase [Modestobacter muralis]